MVTPPERPGPTGDSGYVTSSQLQQNAEPTETAASPVEEFRPPAERPEPGKPPLRQPSARAERMARLRRANACTLRPRCPRCAGFLLTVEGERSCFNCGWVQPPDELLPRPPREREPRDYRLF